MVVMNAKLFLTFCFYLFIFLIFYFVLHTINYFSFNFPNIIISMEPTNLPYSFNNLGGNIYVPFLLLIITLHSTLGKRIFW